MHPRHTTRRLLMRVGGVLLLWLLSVSDSLAAHPPGLAGKPCGPETTSIQRLIRQARLVGGPVAKRVGRSLFRVRPRTAHVERGLHRPSSAEDTQAIQNDAPVAYTEVFIPV